MADRRTGYYVAGRDWPAMGSGIPLEDLYRGLEGITEGGPAVMSDLPAEARDAARDAARPYAADIAEDVITHLARAPAGYDVGTIIGQGLAKAVHDALQAATPSIRADEWAKLQPAIDRVASLAEAAQEKAVAAAVAAERERGDAEAEFIAASVAVWREIDRLDANPGGYHPIKMSVELRERERAAWNRYRDLLESTP